jgi:hypothetical protein
LGFLTLPQRWGWLQPKKGDGAGRRAERIISQEVRFFDRFLE